MKQLPLLLVQHGNLIVRFIVAQNIPILTASRLEGTCATEAMPSTVPRRRLLIGSPRVCVHGIAVSRVGCMSK